MSRKKPFEVVDLFCGAGGQTCGVREACLEDLRRPVQLTAVNHWETAINTHSLNHPDVRHICEPVENLWPARVIRSRHLDLLAAGVECTFHSNARGGGPCNEQSRSQAWQLIRWASDIRVDNILVENVREFTKWGPLHPVTRRPIKSRSGEFFKAFLQTLGNIGYKLEWKIQCAGDFGDATSRQRFILLARLDKKVEWPKESHGPTERVSPFRVLCLTCDTVYNLRKHSFCPECRRRPYRTAREIIDWTLEGKSIFARKKPLCENTLNRIASGLRKFGGAAAEPFLIILRGTGDGHIDASAKSVDGQVPTIEAKGNHICLVQPKTFILPPEGYYRGNTAKDLDGLLPTITAHRGRAFQLVEPIIVQTGQTGGNGIYARPVSKQLATVVTKQEMLLVEPIIVGAGGPSRAGQPKSVDELLGTVLTKNHKMLVEPFVMHLTHHDGHARRCHSLNKLLPTVTCAPRGEMALIEPMLVKYNGKGENCYPIETLLPTITTRDRFALVQFQHRRFLIEKKTRRLVAELDIRTRMLQPHELAAAHSFPKHFKFTGTKEQQTEQIGNSHPVKLARAHARVLLK